MARSRRVSRTTCSQSRTDEGNRYMLLPGLYARDPELRLDDALLCFSAIFSCALGHLFVIILVAADAGNDPQGGSVVL